MEPKVWLITGTSSGFGARFVTQLLERGHRVIATARTLSNIEGKFPASDNLRLLRLDLTDDASQVAAVMEQAISFWGHVDVLLNNAGACVLGLVEDQGVSVFRSHMESNYLGTLNIITGALPHMRARQSGTIVIMGSRSSWTGECLSKSAYAASKAALRVLGEALAAELAQFNIRVLIVEPAAFETEGIWSGLLMEGDEPDYADMRQEVRQWREDSMKTWLNDPNKGVKAIIDVVTGEGFAAGKEWPLYLPLGEAAEMDIRKKMEKITRVMDEWHDFIVDMNPEVPRVSDAPGPGLRVSNLNVGL